MSTSIRNFVISYSARPGAMRMNKITKSMTYHMFDKANKPISQDWARVGLPRLPTPGWHPNYSAGTNGTGGQVVSSTVSRLRWSLRWLNLVQVRRVGIAHQKRCIIVVGGQCPPYGLAMAGRYELRNRNRLPQPKSHAPLRRATRAGRHSQRAHFMPHSAGQEFFLCALCVSAVSKNSGKAWI